MQIPTICGNSITPASRCPSSNGGLTSEAAYQTARRKEIYEAQMPGDAAWGHRWWS